MSRQIHVVIVDPQPLFRDGLARAIRQDSRLRLAAELGDGAAALDAIRRLRPDVAVVDLDCPELDGGRLAAAVACEELGTAIVILGARVRRDVAFDLVAAGVRGVLSKRMAGESVTDAVCRVAAGSSALCADAQTAVTQEIRVRHGDGRELLSRRELDVLALIADGLSSIEIGRRLHLAPSTVKSYTTRVFQRLGVSERAHAVAEAMRRGILT
jgi:two-component system nitrate/nitrite response regulator NarL